MCSNGHGCYQYEVLWFHCFIVSNIQLKKTSISLIKYLKSQNYILTSFLYNVWKWWHWVEYTVIDPLGDFIVSLPQMVLMSSWTKQSATWVSYFKSLIMSILKKTWNIGNFYICQISSINLKSDAPLCSSMDRGKIITQIVYSHSHKWGF